MVYQAGLLGQSRVRWCGLGWDRWARLGDLVSLAPLVGFHGVWFG